MFHVELRQFPHQARAFNLSAADLDARFVRPWVNGEPVRFDDRQWSPEKARIRILEGPELAPEAMGLGRGWATAAKSSADVTDATLASAQRSERRDIDALKTAIAEVARPPAGAIGFPDVLALAASATPQARASEQLRTAEQAVWEMLHRRELEMTIDDRPAPAEQWEAIVLSWETWTGAAAPVARLAAPVPELG